MILIKDRYNLFFYFICFLCNFVELRMMKKILNVASSMQVKEGHSNLLKIAKRDVAD